jgi:hypothetical protein
MSTSERKRPRGRTSFAVCIQNTGYPASLELHKIYRVLPDEDAAAEGDLRIIDESGEDYLYPAEWFAAVELPRRVRTSLLTVRTRA